MLYGLINPCIHLMESHQFYIHSYYPSQIYCYYHFQGHIFNISANCKPHRWCNGWHARLEGGRSWGRAPICSNQRLQNWHLLLLRKACNIKEKKQRLVGLESDNVSKWGDMSTCGLLFR